MVKVFPDLENEAPFPLVKEKFPSTPLESVTLTWLPLMVTVGAEPERSRHHAVREDLRLVRQLSGAGPKRFGSESVSFFTHRGKISFNRMQI